MSRKQEIEQQIKKINEGIEGLPDDLKQELLDKKKQLEDELAGLSEDDSEPKPKKKNEKPVTSVEGVGAIREAILATLKDLQKVQGLNSSQIEALIANYFESRKIQLNELSEDVIQEIQKAQKKVLEIPNFGLKVEVSSADENVPYFYEILDDVLAGNPVFLVGPAGSGKTVSAERVAAILKREYITLNSSQYTSPTEILGGQTIEGYKEGKLIDCWKTGKILIIDEMPKLDSNTAGLFNDALAKVSHTRPAKDAKINSTNPSEPPIPRNDNFAVVATGNIYPNMPPPEYRGNNQQDLSLLDRFSGSVYFVNYNRSIDDVTTRFSFLYELLVGNYYEYIAAKKNKTALPEPVGLRTILESANLQNLALVSYRTNVAFRVAFEFELVRSIAKAQGKDVPDVSRGKTLWKAIQSWLVAFDEDSRRTILTKSSMTEKSVQLRVDIVIQKIIQSKDGFLNSLNQSVKEYALPMYDRYENFFVAENVKV